MKHINLIILLLIFTTSICAQNKQLQESEDDKVETQIGRIYKPQKDDIIECNEVDLFGMRGCECIMSDQSVRMFDNVVGIDCPVSAKTKS